MPTTKKTQWNKVGCPFGLGIIILLITLFLVSCKDVTYYPPAVRFIAPPEWESDFKAMEQCSNRQRPYNIDWFISQAQLYDNTGHALDGAWYEGTNDIYLMPAVVDADSPYAEWNKQRIRMHEMLHYILGTTGHPKEFDDCGVR